MNKKELVKIVAAKLGITEKTTNLVLSEIIETIGETIADGENVVLVDFGTFQLRFRKGREGRNPRDGSTVQIPDVTLPFFKAGKRLKERVNDRQNITCVDRQNGME